MQPGCALFLDRHSDRTVVLERGAVQWSGESRALREDKGLRRRVLWL